MKVVVDLMEYAVHTGGCVLSTRSKREHWNSGWIGSPQSKPKVLRRYRGFIYRHERESTGSSAVVETVFDGCLFQSKAEKAMRWKHGRRGWPERNRLLWWVIYFYWRILIIYRARSSRSTRRYFDNYRSGKKLCWLRLRRHSQLRLVGSSSC